MHHPYHHLERMPRSQLAHHTCPNHHAHMLTCSLWVMCSHTYHAFTKKETWLFKKESWVFGKETQQRIIHKMNQFLHPWELIHPENQNLQFSLPNALSIFWFDSLPNSMSCPWFISQSKLILWLDSFTCFIFPNALLKLSVELIERLVPSLTADKLCSFSFLLFSHGLTFNFSFLPSQSISSCKAKAAYWYRCTVLACSLKRETRQ